jgi:hypothetical protein
MKIYDGQCFREMTEEEIAELKNSTPVEETPESAEEKLARLEKILTTLTARFNNIFGTED